MCCENTLELNTGNSSLNFFQLHLIVATMLSSIPPPVLIVCPKYENLFTTYKDLLCTRTYSVGHPSNGLTQLYTFCTYKSATYLKLQSMMIVTTNPFLTCVTVTYHYFCLLHIYLMSFCPHPSFHFLKVSKTNIYGSNNGV